jgi:hypothetical protein
VGRHLTNDSRTIGANAFYPGIEELERAIARQRRKIPEHRTMAVHLTVLILNIS